MERTAGRVEELRGRGAPDLLPERWAELEGACPAVEPPAGEAASCAAVEAQLARIGGAAECLAIASLIDAELPQAWTQVVTAAHDRAVAAQQLALATPSADAHYRAAFDSARARLNAGSSADGRWNSIEFGRGGTNSGDLYPRGICRPHVWNDDPVDGHWTSVRYRVFATGQKLVAGDVG